MYSRAFVVVCNAPYLPGLWALLNSILAYHGTDLRLFVALHGPISPQAHQWLREHPLSTAVTWLHTDDFTPPPRGVWEAKQLVLSHLAGRAQVVCLLDADLVLTSRLDDVFVAAEQGRIVSSRDGVHDRVFEPEYAVYSPTLVGRRFPYFNSGFFCLDLVRYWDVAALWAFTERFAAYSPGGGTPFAFPGHGDQGLLNAVVAMAGKKEHLEILPQAEWCNSAHWTPERTVTIDKRDGNRLEVRNTSSGLRQRLLHSTGPKWWTPDGRDHFSRCGDVLRCFEHFANVPVMSPFTNPD